MSVYGVHMPASTPVLNPYGGRGGQGEVQSATTSFSCPNITSYHRRELLAAGRDWDCLECL